MTDLIKRKDAIEVAYQLRRKPNDEEWDEWLESFNGIPSADRLKGEWKVNILNYESVCSVCGANEANFIYGTEMWYGLGESKFCPNCGANMRKGGSE